MDNHRTKTCARCLQPKLVEEFYLRLGKWLTSYCKECQKDIVYQSKVVLRDRQRKMVNALKDKPCMDCGEPHPPWAMDFDHRDPALKKFNVAEMTSKGLSDKHILAEIAKCDVVCALCHRYRTYGQKRSPTTLL